jgi:hypothetical protein
MVVTAYTKTSKRISSLSSRESLTVVKAINTEGKIIPPLIIPKGAVHMEEWYKLYRKKICLLHQLQIDL